MDVVVLTEIMITQRVIFALTVFMFIGYIENSNKITVQCTALLVRGNVRTRADQHEFRVDNGIVVYSVCICYQGQMLQDVLGSLLAPHASVDLYPPFAWEKRLNRIFY